MDARSVVDEVVVDEVVVDEALVNGTAVTVVGVTVLTRSATSPRRDGGPAMTTPSTVPAATTRTGIHRWPGTTTRA